MTFKVPYAADKAIMAVLKDGPLTTREISDRLIEKARREWASEHGYDDIEWGGSEEPHGARLLAASRARKQGMKLHVFEIRPRLLALEKQRKVERIQVEPRSHVMWRLP